MSLLGDTPPEGTLTARSTDRRYGLQPVFSVAFWNIHGRATLKGENPLPIRSEEMSNEMVMRYQRLEIPDTLHVDGVRNGILASS